MPNYNAHTYFGQRVLQNLSLALRRRCTRDLPVFRLGLYGPDPLIFSYLTKASSDYLHRNWREVTLPLLEQAIREDDPVNASFAAGYLLHQLLDDTIHPWIYRCMETDGSSHFRLEIQLDRIILREQGCHRLPGMSVEGKDRAAAAAEYFLCPATREQYLRGLWRMASLSQLFSRMRGHTLRKLPEAERHQAVDLRNMLEAAVEPAARQLRELLAPVPAQV